jgi:predicted PurR-regulated permease PerM
LKQDPYRRTRGLIFNTVTVPVALALALYSCWLLRPLILPTVLGVLLAFLVRPLKTVFKNHWMPESVRIGILLTALSAVLLASIQFVKASIPNEKESLEIQVRLKYKFNQKFAEVMGLDAKTGKGNSLYNLVAADVNPMVKTVNGILSLSEDQRESFERFADGVPGVAPVPDVYYKYFLENEAEALKESKQLAKKKKESAVPSAPVLPAEKDHSWVMEAMDLISIWLVLPFVFVFFLLDEDAIVQFFISLVPNRFFELSLTMREQVDQAIGEYLRGVCLECGLVGISLAIGFYVMGIPLNMSLLIAALSGFATAIPFFGPLVGVGFGLVYVLISEQLSPLVPFINQGNSPLAVIVVNLIVLALDNLVFQPIVLGGAVNLHPLVIVLGLTAGSMLFGLAGVLLAIPAIVVAKVVISSAFRGLRDYRII